MSEGRNSLVQAAEARACGYRTTENFITIAYLVSHAASPGPMESAGFNLKAESRI